jgi:hypothetical protein
MLGSVFIYSHLISMLVCKDKILEELVFEFCGSVEVLSIRSNFWFQAYQIKVETLAISNALHQFCKMGLATTCEEHREGIFLLNAQLDELNLSMVNTSNLCLGQECLQ